MSKNNYWGWFWFILFLLAVVFTLGLVLSVEGEKEPTESEPEPDNETKLRERIAQLDKLILPLAANREELRRSQKRLLIKARILICLGILLTNGLMWWFCNYDFDIGRQVNYNEAGILLYSFVGFLISGTPSKFAVALRKGAVKRLNKKHEPMLLELEALEVEREQVLLELKLLLGK